MFKYEEIVSFCQKQGIAIFDTAQAIRRLQGNAAKKAEAYQRMFNERRKY